MNEHMQSFVRDLGKVNVYIIGRHNPDFGGLSDKIDVVGQEALQFASTSEECLKQLEDVRLRAHKAGAHVVLFQGLPGQVAACFPRIKSQCYELAWDKYDFDTNVLPRFGVIVSVPGERPAGVSKSFWVSDDVDLEAVKKAVAFANPRAKLRDWEPNDYGSVMGVDIIVDPPMRFEFSHIEWLS